MGQEINGLNAPEVRAWPDWPRHKPISPGKQLTSLSHLFIFEKILPSILTQHFILASGKMLKAFSSH